MRGQGRQRAFQGVTVQPMVKLDGYELILGSSIDPQFGPVLLFGAGGQLVEVFKDRALALPPLNTTLARRMMEQTRIFTALKGVRGRRPVDLAALEQLLVRFSQLVVEQRWIKEIDINPLLASPERLLALDARVVVYGSEIRDEQLPRSWPSAPTRPSTSHLDPQGRQCGHDPPIRPEDEPLMVKFHADALRAERLPPLLPRDEAEPAGGPRAADPDLLHRLRPRDGLGCRPQGPRDRRARDIGVGR